MIWRAMLFVWFAVLAGDAAAEGPVTVTPLLQADRTNTGATIAYPKTDRPEITTAIVEIAPGGETPLHKHPVPVIGYILEGSLIVETADGIRNEYAAGDAFLESVDTLHHGRNPGETPTRILVSYIGVKGEPNTLAADQPQ